MSLFNKLIKFISSLFSSWCSLLWLLLVRSIIDQLSTCLSAHISRLCSLNICSFIILYYVLNHHALLSEPLYLTCRNIIYGYITALISQEPHPEPGLLKWCIGGLGEPLPVILLRYKLQVKLRQVSDLLQITFSRSSWRRKQDMCYGQWNTNITVIVRELNI